MTVILCGDVDDNVIFTSNGPRFFVRVGGDLQMQFLMEIDKVKRVTAMTVSQNRKYLAVIELLHEHDLNQVKMLSTTLLRNLASRLQSSYASRDSARACPCAMV